MDRVRFAILGILSCAEDRIHQYPLRVMTIFFPMHFHGILGLCRFIEGVPSEVFDPQESVHFVHLFLRAELYFRVLLSSNDRTNPRLTQTDNALVYCVSRQKTGLHAEVAMLHLFSFYRYVCGFFLSISLTL